MKKLRYILILTIGILFSNCNDWLEILPDNEQPSSEYWQSKEDVEAMLASGYYYMRQCTPSFIDWGELRGASISLTNAGGDKGKLQNFELTPNEGISKWGTIYQVINIANSVLQYAEPVLVKDATYTEAAMNSHRTEAYFMRALMYFYLVRNFKEVPLITTAYVDDSTPYDMAKSSEEEIIAKIKEDITKALDTGAAKETHDATWANKGRATKWSLYALMADVCLWSEDYENCIIYANKLIEATAKIKPVFITDPTKWFEIFYPGNSNESIFEMNWDYASYQETANSPSQYFNMAAGSGYRFKGPMLERLINETTETSPIGAVRSYFGAYAPETNSYLLSEEAYIWKYIGAGYQDIGAVRANNDANFIIYRMADIMLMKAEAMILQGESSWQGALDIINQIRNRSNLRDLEITLSEVSELDMMLLLLNERDMELAAEGKRWYDLVRLGKCKNYKYKESFINIIVENNTEKSPKWLRSALKNEYAWYLPIHKDDIESNRLLVQNPYYDVTTN